MTQLTIEKTNARKLDWQERNRKARLFVFHSGETLAENLVERHARPYEVYRAALPQLLAAVGLPADTKAAWRQKAGCSCGCSPGFVLDGVSGADYFVTVTAAAPEKPAQRSGRGPSGKLRNFRAMTDEKLWAVAGQLRREANDTEAYEAAIAELVRR